MTEPPVIVTVDGTPYGAWTALDARCGIEYMASAFTVQATDRWALGELAPILPGQACALTIAGQTIITGHVDALTREIDARSRGVRVTGRDRTADLVDCSATGGPWLQQTLEAIAREVCAEYAVPVQTHGDTGAPFERVAVEPGESIYELLERLARARGVLLMPDGAGGLVIGQPGRTEAPDALDLGTNLLSLIYTLDYSDRFGEYVVRGQSAGSDQRSGKDAAQVRALATDDGVAQHRLRRKIIVAEGNDSDLQARAEWERAVRNGRSLTARARVQGWTVDGALWRAGQLVQITAGLGLDARLLISGVTYSLDPRGTVTELELTKPEAFTPEPPGKDPQ